MIVPYVRRMRERHDCFPMFVARGNGMIVPYVRRARACPSPCYLSEAGFTRFTRFARKEQDLHGHACQDNQVFLIVTLTRFTRLRFACNDTVRTQRRARCAENLILLILEILKILL